MSDFKSRGHSVAARFGVLGGVLGVGAGIIQATMGSRIPDWTGAKADPGALGLLTIALSVLAGLAAARQANSGITVGSRTACSLGLFVPGLLGAPGSWVCRLAGSVPGSGRWVSTLQARAW
jgi:hypothetical protein